MIKLLTFCLLLISQTNYVLAKVSIKSQDGFIIIKSDGIPDHDTGQFPNAQNPNSIESQDYNFKVTETPIINDETTAVGRNIFGIAKNGIPFDSATAEYWQKNPNSGWKIEAIKGEQKLLGLDNNNAHVQKNGAYHYHGNPNAITDHSSKIEFIGYAADGFPIYINTNLQPSYQLKSGKRPNDAPEGYYDGTYTEDYEFIEGSGDLGECNNYFGVTAEYLDGINYYVVSNQFPYVPRCWIGVADESFMKKTDRSQMAQINRSRRSMTKPLNSNSIKQKSPMEAQVVCYTKRLGESCSFSGRGGKRLKGRCTKDVNGVSCKVNRRAGIR
ncbi:MAG: YHYH protein [Rickettsiales bacterium]|nr:YHYH protein [Rickettsiales bacterium]